MTPEDGDDIGTTEGPDPIAPGGEAGALGPSCAHVNSSPRVCRLPGTEEDSLSSSLFAGEVKCLQPSLPSVALGEEES